MKDLKNELFAGALENARFGICVVDESGRVVLTNKAFVSRLNNCIDNVLGQSYVAMLNCFGAHPDFHKLFSVREPELSIECPITASDGRQHYLLMQSSALAHESGELFRIVSVIDVTDYGVTRDRFTEMQRHVEAINNSVVIVDARKPDMPITYVNAHFERMTGYSKAEIIGRNCRFLQGNERDQPGVIALRAAIKKHESCQVWLKNFRKDGSEFLNELYISPVFDEFGTLTHYVGTQHEVMDRKLVAAGLEQAGNETP